MILGRQCDGEQNKLAACDLVRACCLEPPSRIQLEMTLPMEWKLMVNLGTLQHHESVHEKYMHGFSWMMHQKNSWSIMISRSNTWSKFVLNETEKKRHTEPPSPNVAGCWTSGGDSWKPFADEVWRCLIAQDGSLVLQPGPDRTTCGILQRIQTKNDLGSNGIWGPFLTIIRKKSNAISSVHICLSMPHW